jgi:succinyl-CoA synthetase beta subunit
MGKKYDAYSKAVQAENQAKARLSDVQGGATERAMTEAVNNAKSAEAVSNVLFNEFIQDPEG